MSKLPTYLLPKYLRFDRTQPFISVTAILAILGVGIGVMVLCVAMAIMNGMTKEFERKLFIMNYPISVFSKTYQGVDSAIFTALKEKFPHLLFSPYLRYNALSRAGGDMNAAVVIGVDIDLEIKLNEVVRGVFSTPDSQMLDSAKIEKFKSQNFPAIIGKELQLRHFLEIDDKLTLYFSQVEPNALSLSPLSKRFDIVEIFDSGLKAYNDAYIYTNLQSLQKIRRLPSDLYDGIHIYSTEPFKDITHIKEFLESAFPNRVGIEGWWEQNGNFFSAMELEKRALFVVLMLIILMASLNIISSLLMVVMTRRREIALMLSLGMSEKEIKQTFFSLGAFIGGCGIVLGVVLNFVALFVLDTFPIISLPQDVYGTSKLPLDLSIVDFVATIFGAGVIVCLASYYPAKKASKIDALSVLRNE